MAANSNSLTRCLSSLECTLNSKSTGRPEFKRYIETTSGCLRDDHILIFEFLVECLTIYSDETSAIDKVTKARELTNGKACTNPSKIKLNPEIVEKLRNLEDIDNAQLEGELSLEIKEKLENLKETVREVFDLNKGLTLGTVFDDFVAAKRAKKPCIPKKSRTCETL